ncbi:MAG TPA: arsenic transporter [Caulobacteraceae bacterium]|nr:arsenic transporter [Caulobacteraceae bacterium]
MNAGQAAHLITWIICATATAGVIVRPFRWPEAIWAVAGAVVLVATGLLPLAQAWTAIGKGADVYLFLAGMMLLSEVAREEGLFDRVAAFAVNHAGGSPRRLFVLVYGAGTVVTALLSNDATAVVLTPAVYAAARAARAEPLPHLLVCALIANAASFLLPISNPANIVLYGDHTPPLGPWLTAFLLPSAASILVTFIALRLAERRGLAGECARRVETPPMTAGAWTAVTGIALTAVVLLTVSALDLRLGPPTFVMGSVTAMIVWVRGRSQPLKTLRAVSWQVLFLVAGLFVLVQALGATGLTGQLARFLAQASRASARETAAVAGAAIGVVCNLMNNLPAGLVAASAVQQARPPQMVTDALLIGVDLGPNFSVTGSLATILWLTAIRREGESVGFLRFLKVGVIVAPPALALALAARLFVG